jgi:two-component system response regulator HydG
LETREIVPLGARAATTLDIRVISATNRDLRELSLKGEFRCELYYRLDEGRIHIPPLRERPEDIMPLAEYFLRESFSKHNLIPPKITLEAQKAMESHSWPGNVRELRNLTRRMVAERPGSSLELPHLPDDFKRESPPEQERRKILSAVETTRWNITKAARLLGWSRQKLYDKLKQHGIDYK